MHDRVRLQRNQSVSGDAVRDELDAPRHLLSRLDLHVLELTLLADAVAALGQAVFGVDFGPVLRDHEADADPRVPFFARFGEKDHVAVERDVEPLQRQHRHDSRGQVVLVVDRSTSVDVAAGALGAEWSVLPFRRVDSDGVEVTHDEQRTLSSVALEPRDHVRPIGIGCENLRGNAVVVEDFLDVLGRGALLRGGVEAHQRLIVTKRFFFDLRPVGSRLRHQRRRRKPGGHHECSTLHGFPPGTRCFSSSNQFCTTTNWGAPRVLDCLMMAARRPSGAKS